MVYADETAYDGVDADRARLARAVTTQTTRDGVGSTPSLARRRAPSAADQPMLTAAAPGAFRRIAPDPPTHFTADEWKERALYEQAVRLRVEHRLVTLHPELGVELAHVCGRTCEEARGTGRGAICAAF
jgi:hypothetical protein